MDNKITKKRLNEHLSYDWIKYICIFLAVVMLWYIIFTMMSPRIPTNKQFSLYSVLPSTIIAEEEILTNKIEEDLKNTTLEFTISNWNPYDTTTAALIQTRLVSKEVDMMIIDNMQNTDDTEYYSTFNEYADSGIFDCLEDLIYDAINYEFSETEYRQRIIDEKKFNKIDTEAEILLAIETEKERVAKASSNARKLAGYLGLASKFKITGDDIPNEIVGLAYNYSKYTQAIATDDEISPSLTVEDSKVWGINIGEVNGVLPLKQITSWIYYADDTSLQYDEDAVREYALGITFSADNMPYVYSNLNVINIIIERYK